MKKSILFSLLAIMMIAMTGVGFMACSSSDDDGGGLSGTWVCKEGHHEITLKFKSGNSGTWIDKYNDYYSGYETVTGTFTYEMEGEHRAMVFIQAYDSYYGHEVEIYYCVIEDDTLYLFEDDYGVDLEYVFTRV